MQALVPLIEQNIKNHPIYEYCSNSSPEDFFKLLAHAAPIKPSDDYRHAAPSEIIAIAAGHEHNRIAAYDVGSTGTRVTIADVNICDPNQFKVIGYLSISTPFEITHETIPHRLLLYQEIKNCIDSLYSSGTQPVFHYARATAGFRNAGELGVELAMKIRTVSGINFKVAQQEKEGWFSYESVAKTIANAPEELVVWDVGGGSIQVTTQEAGRYVTLGSSYASRSIIPIINAEVKKIKTLNEPLFPMSLGQIQQALSIVSELNVHGSYEAYTNKNSFLKNAQAAKLILDRIHNTGTVYGVGDFHHRSMRKYVAPANNHYTRAQVKALLLELADLTQTQAQDLLDGHEDPFFKYLLSDLILAYSTMQTLGISKVNTLAVDNGIGLVHLGHQKLLNTSTPHECSTQSWDGSCTAN
ncbi:MAG TPA: hypothetical protein PLV25_01115 [Opitutales bacterium]|nr:hypothetical protein [Opitutales bacterium]